MKSIILFAPLGPVFTSLQPQGEYYSANTVRPRFTLSLCPGKCSLDRNSLDIGNDTYWDVILPTIAFKEVSTYYAINGSKIIA